MIIKYGTFGFIVHEVNDTVQSFAGTTSIADLKFFAETSGFGWLIGIVGIFFGVGMWNTKRKTDNLYTEQIKRSAKTIRYLEKSIDPSRTSSNLLSSGESHPKD